MGNLESYARIMVSCAVIYLFIIIFLRIFGKKELAQLSIVDLVFILLLANAVQNSMVGSDSSLMGGLVAATTLFVANYIIKYLLFKFPKLGGLVQGHPVLLIYKGEMNLKNMAKVEITISEMEEAVREHGVARVSQVDLAVLEVDGNISILSHEFARKTQKKRKGRKRVTSTV
jgi:uncharacterized membrane protein YcaP (DUF421 family)